MYRMKPVYVIIGFPGSGKDTQGDMLAQKTGIPHLGAGKTIKEYLDRNPKDYEQRLKSFQGGPTNPTEILFAAIFMKLETLDTTKGFILTQNPNSAREIEEELKVLRENGYEFKKAFYLDIDRETAIKRAMDRLGGVFTEKEPSEEALIKRIDNYIPTITEAKEYFAKVGLLESIDASQSVDEVNEDILSLIRNT